jgi:pyruvate kinase
VRRTKLVCTIGPASRERIAELVGAGMDVARLNFSHGTPDEHRDALRHVRDTAEQAGRALAVVADLPGPKVRLGDLVRSEVELEPDDLLTLLPPGESLDREGLSATVTYAGLAADVRTGDRLMLADGAVELRVRETDGRAIRAEVIRGGLLRPGAGLNVPSERLSLPGVTERDRSLLKSVLEMGVDYVAQSFVRRAADIHELRSLMGEVAVPIVAKIETRAAINNLDEILATADAVMLARGDLGVELPFAEVPVIQKRVISACIAAGVPVIVATQMLESMVGAARPTRAEANDVANAVLDGADAVMLSAETAIGAFPIEAARAALAISSAAEAAGAAARPAGWTEVESEAGAIAAAAVDLAMRATDPPVNGIACFTRSGLTAQLLSSQRPRCPVYALSPDDAVVRRLALWRSVVPLHANAPRDTDEMIRLADETLQAAGLPPGGRIVIVASIPFGEARTNFIKLHRLGSA